MTLSFKRMREAYPIQGNGGRIFLSNANFKVKSPATAAGIDEAKREGLRVEGLKLHE